MQLTATSGSALAGEDFASLSRRVVWPDGDGAEKTLALVTLDDAAAEGPETLEVVLSDPRGDVALGATTRATVIIEDDDAELTSCESQGQTVLCLAGRFAARVGWRNASGDTGTARAVPDAASADSGVLWFFAAENWEMLVKIVDGCAANGHFWVFAVTTTDVEYTLQVTDTESGEAASYFNPLGRAAPAITDVEAFATCP